MAMGSATACRNGGISIHCHGQCHWQNAKKENKMDGRKEWRRWPTLVKSRLKMGGETMAGGKKDLEETINEGEFEN